MEILPNLNILRFFLAIIVVLYHTPLFSESLKLPFYNDMVILQRGGEAVKFFFTLSGFLIIRLLYVEKTKMGNIALKHFYLRRILRIYPVYYLVILVGVLVYHVLLPLANIPFQNNYSLLQLAGYYIFFIPNIFNVIYDPGAILLVIWSIGIEEQFYLFIPVLFHFLKVKYILPALLILISIYIVLFFNSDTLKHFDMMYFYLLFGGILSINYQHFKFLKNNFLRLILFALVIIIFFTKAFDFYGRIFHDLGIMVVSGFFITMIAYYPPIEIKNKLLNYLGQISYGIYMYHYIVLNALIFIYMKFGIASKISPALTIVSINLFTIIATILASHLSFKYYESWFLGLKKRNKLIS